MRTPTRWIAVVLIAGVGCAQVSKEQGHDYLADQLRRRASADTHWQQGPPEPDELKRLIDAKLAGSLKLQSAVELALANNPTLCALYEDIGIAQAEMVQATLLTNPTLTGSIGFPINKRGTLESELGIALNILELLTLPARKRVAEKRFAAEVRHVTHEALRVVFEVRHHYIDIQAMQQLLELRLDLVEAAEAAADLAERQYTAGNITDLTRANEQAAYQQARVDLGRDQLTLIEKKESLTRLLGLTGDHVAWRIEEALGDLPSSEPEVEPLEATVAERRLDLQSARLQVELAGNALTLAKTTRFFGRIDVGAHSHQDPNGPVLLGPTLSLDLPIFDQRQALIARLEAQHRQATRRLAGLLVDAQSEVRVARARLLALRALAKHYRDELLPLRSRIVDETLLQYNAMTVALYQLVSAKQQDIEARRTYLELLRDYWTAQAELERALGGALPQAEQDHG